MPATAFSQPHVSEQAQKKGCAESVEDRKKSGQSLQEGSQAWPARTGLRVGLMVTLYELAMPATAISQPHVSEQAQEKCWAESVEDRKKAGRNLQKTEKSLGRVCKKDRRHGLLVQER